MKKMCILLVLSLVSLLVGCTTPASTIAVTQPITTSTSLTTQTTPLTSSTTVSTQVVDTTTTQVFTLPPAPTTTADTRKVIITFSPTLLTQIGTGYYPEKPDKGNIFLVLDMTIENKGYEEFNTNPNYFYVVINNIKYDYSWASSGLDNRLPTIDLLNNGKVSGQLAFEVPTGSANFTPLYEAWSKYNVQWVAK